MQTISIIFERGGRSHPKSCFHPLQNYLSLIEGPSRKEEQVIFPRVQELFFSCLRPGGKGSASFGEESDGWGGKKTWTRVRRRPRGRHRRNLIPRGLKFLSGERKRKTPRILGKSKGRRKLTSKIFFPGAAEKNEKLLAHH